MSDDVINALKSISLDTAMTSEELWSDSGRVDVPSINGSAFNIITNEFGKLSNDIKRSPHILPLIGEPGSGKTHLLRRTRRHVQSNDGLFVPLQFSRNGNPWSEVATGFYDALSRPHSRGGSQVQHLITQIADAFELDDDNRHRLGSSVDRDGIEAMLRAVADSDIDFYRMRNETIRALLHNTSRDPYMNQAGASYLRGEGPLDPEGQWGPPTSSMPTAEKIVSDILNLCSYAGGTIIAIDQTDELVRNVSIGSGSAEPADKEHLVEITECLMDLRDKSKRSMIMMSCIFSTWELLKSHASEAADGRFTDHIQLGRIPDSNAAKELTAALLAPAYRDVDVPYNTYPFPESFFTAAPHFSLRKFLGRIERAVRNIAESGSLTISDEDLSELAPHGTNSFDTRFEELTEQCDPDEVYFNKDSEKQLLPNVTRAILECLRRQNNRMDLDLSPYGIGNNADAPAFLQEIDSEGSRWNVRVAATTAGQGVTAKLNKFRTHHQRPSVRPGERSILIISEECHRGLKSRALQRIAEFSDIGDVVAVNRLERAKMYALYRLLEENDEGLTAWLQTRRPCDDFSFAKYLPPSKGVSQPEPNDDAPQQSGNTIDIALSNLPESFLRSPAPSPDSADDPSSAVDSAATRTPEDEQASVHLPMQRSDSDDAPQRPIELGDVAKESVFVRPEKLREHVAIVAGTGSGKTVLLKRIIEQAALSGISVVVVDPNNDLSLLKCGREDTPGSWTPVDEDNAKSFASDVDVVVWTPNKVKGRPLSFPVFPDFAAAMDDPDDFATAIDNACETLLPRLNFTPRTKTKGEAVLRECLEGFARRGSGSMEDFIAFVREGNITESFDDSLKIADNIAETLTALSVNDRFFGGGYGTTDVSELLTPENGARSRVSVVNLSGLPGDEPRQTFINRLNNALFSWVKKNPSSSGTPQALLVLDEAQTIAPSQKSTASLQSTRTIASQARKFGLGLLVATQSPSGIDNQIIGNCMTHVYGRLVQPTQVKRAEEIAAGISSRKFNFQGLGRGEFYLVGENAPNSAFHSRMCLTLHSPSAPSDDDVLDLASKS
ncbi:helicase HerA domain-containing protein [Haloglycomyces albus]|uniref:helicase HerA domain-containing protein n=1 Tax=Haloglycomyces albus TaxID=526067 RepID=UPI00046CD00B|nr:DUF87 domain-containing protein [Haloglycomyces albus]